MVSRFLPRLESRVEESRILDFETPTESVVKSGEESDGKAYLELKEPAPAVVLVLAPDLE